MGYYGAEGEILSALGIVGGPWAPRAPNPVVFSALNTKITFCVFLDVKDGKH